MAANVRPERLDFVVGKLAPLASRQIAKHDRTLADTDQP
jgi:hypothetical protein